MLHIAIVENEPARRRELARLTDRYFSCAGLSASVRPFRSGEELLDDGHCYELIFLGPENGSGAGPSAASGIRTAERLRESQRAGYFLFITDSRETAWEAAGLEASDCLPYPLDEDPFRMALDRVLFRLQSAETGCIRIPAPGHTCRIVFRSEIRYCEALSHRTLMHTRNSSCDCRHPLKELAALLGARFFQCHRCILVNLDWVRGYEDGFMLLLDGTRLPVARSRRQDFLQAVVRTTSGRRQ